MPPSGGVCCRHSTSLALTQWSSLVIATTLGRMKSSTREHVEGVREAGGGGGGTRRVLLATRPRPPARPPSHQSPPTTPHPNNTHPPARPRCREGRRLGVEFDTPAITAIGFAEDIYTQFESKASVGAWVCGVGMRVSVWGGCRVGRRGRVRMLMRSARHTHAWQVGRLAKLLPLWLFTPWIEDALKAANPDTLQVCVCVWRG